jgi:hypothetical protein
MEAIKVGGLQQKGPPHRNSVTESFHELGIHIITLYKWCKAWFLHIEMVPASRKEAEGWGCSDKFMVIRESDSPNAPELGAYCWDRGLCPEQVDIWCHGVKYANARPMQTMDEKKNLEKRPHQHQREIKSLQQ